MTAPAQDGGQGDVEDHSSWKLPPKARPRVATRAGHSLKRAETVLLVDGAPMMRGVMARVLRQSGYRVVEAAGSLEAQRLAAHCGSIQLLLVNHSVPEHTDLELALWFRAMYPEMKILVACVSLWDLNYVVGQEHQINFLAKPFTAHELAQTVQRVLAD